MSISTEQQMLVEQRVSNDKKSVGVAYLLWIFVGMFGAHRFYVGKVGSGFVLIGLWFGGILFLSSDSLLGPIMLIIAGIWLLLDLFIIPSLVSSNTNQLRGKITLEVIGSGSSKT